MKPRRPTLASHWEHSQAGRLVRKAYTVTLGLIDPDVNRAISDLGAGNLPPGPSG
jgi:hypothetical protein